jgi:hypothetical protein
MKVAVFVQRKRGFHTGFVGSKPGEARETSESLHEAW